MNEVVHGRVTIFDTTLRDGEQGAGFSMKSADKIHIAHALEQAGVDVIEAGFPAANTQVFEVVQKIASESKRVGVCALARGTEADIAAACAAVQPAGDRGRVHVFVATNAQHMQLKLRMTEQSVLERIHSRVRQARSAVSQVQFSPEVATTSEFGFLCASIRSAIDAGATVINVADTTGHCFPWEYSDLIQRLYGAIAELSTVQVSVHCHNDRGVATANSLFGLQAGARQVECTINGIGERAGNTSLEEVVMALTLRAEAFGLHHGFDTRQLMYLSQLVATATNVPVPPNKAFVGANAFAHESGIHQAGVLTEPSLYELCCPSIVGASRRLPTSKLSGRQGVSYFLRTLGYSSEVVSVHVDTVYEVYMDRVQDDSDPAGNILKECAEMVINNKRQ